MMKVRTALEITSVSMVLCVGCGYRDGDIVSDRGWRIEFVPPKAPQIHAVEVEQIADGLVVTGFGTRTGGNGLIRVEVLSEGDKVLEQIEATILPPLAVPKRSYNYRFRALISVVPPDGSVIRVIYYRL